jgi:hypothetical protein
MFCFIQIRRDEGMFWLSIQDKPGLCDKASHSIIIASEFVKYIELIEIVFVRISP